MGRGVDAVRDAYGLKALRGAEVLGMLDKEGKVVSRQKGEDFVPPQVCRTGSGFVICEGGLTDRAGEVGRESVCV